MIEEATETSVGSGVNVDWFHVATNAEGAWEEFEPYAKDILDEYVEYKERTRTMMYDHPIDQPDDGLHSLAYCMLAADISMGRF